MTRLRILQERTSFLGYDERCRENLKTLRPVLEPAIEGILDDFYQFMRERPETRDLLPTAEVALRARQAQQAHWLQLLSGEDIGEEHSARAAQVGHTHERIGLGPSAYLGGYCIALNRFCECLAVRYRDDPGTLADMLQSLQKAAFLDMGFVIESYLDAKNASIRKILLNAEHFIAEVEQIEGGLAALGGSMEPAAETLAVGLGDCRERLAALREALPDGESQGRAERLQAALAACENSAESIGAKCQVFSRQLRQLTEEVVARRKGHRPSFSPPAPQGFLPRLKRAAQILFSSDPS